MVYHELLWLIVALSTYCVSLTLVAGKLGKTHKDVMLYNLQPDPCACLLRDWGLTATVQQLLEELDRLGRSDVSGMVREYMETH